MSDIWSKTYRNDHLVGQGAVSILTAVNEAERTERYLVGELQILATSASGVQASASATLTPKQMRALADLLNASASRIEDDLIPLLTPAPEIIPFQLYTELEAA